MHSLKVRLNSFEEGRPKDGLIIRTLRLDLHQL